MAWEAGSQKRAVKEDFNKLLSEIEGYIDEDEAKILLYKFLKENITFAADLISGVELFPFQHMAIKAMFETDYTLGVWSRGMSKSFTTGIYAFLDAIFNQGIEIGILSKSFRQSKMIFKKIEDIAAKPEASFLAQCITHKSKSNDEWLLEIGQSRIRALPLGDGSKLRGFRFHRIIIDEFLLMPERIYNEVIVPFLSVVENPVERERMYQIENKLIKEGKMKEEDRHKWPNNKLIALSSASYKFEYLYKVYEQFEMLINGSIKEDGDATRCIMQFSYDCAPQKLYDENLILQSKQTMSHSQFEREFGAIFTDDSSGYFKTSKMAECTVPDGEEPSVEVKGDPGSEYIVSFDPSWAESESSDDFAMHVFKINNETRQGTMVHGYALSGTNLKHHIKYFHYLLTNFNVVAVVGDYNGGVQFINACNESSLFHQSKIKISMLSSDFDKPEKYQEDLAVAKKEYDKNSKCYCVLRKPTSSWIRMANELLQSNLDHKRVWFGSRAMDESYHKQIKQKIPINDLKYLNIAHQKENTGAKMIDFVEHQSDMIALTKTECALVQIKTTSQGTQTFDLPDTLKRTTGPNKARKDSYSSLVLGNWMVKVYYDFIGYEPTVNQVTTFTPSFIK
jgi:hypothetical protein